MDGDGKMNADIRQWGRGTIGDLKQQFALLKIEHVTRSPSPVAAIEALKNYFAERQGLINKVSFKFPRHMVFVHKGVGKGRPAAQPGTAKEWFNPVIDADIEKLADIVANNQGDMIVSNLLIR